MKAWVLDSSFALAWALPDEASASANRFLRGLPREAELWVPSLWWYEIANALVTAERRGRVSEADALRILELYRGLPLETDSAGGPEALWRFRSLAREHDLSAYDAAYLELAGRRHLTLASLDSKLRRAAARAGVRCL